MEQLKTGSKEPLIMPGPKFGESDGWWSRFNKWIKKHRQRLTIVIIGLLIIAGGIYLYSNYQKSSQLISPEESVLEEEEGTVKPEQIKIEEQQAQPQEAVAQAKEKAEIVKAESGSITVKANKGAGVTHLARQALKEYLQIHPELAQNLTPEHKIYIEDYLKDKTGSFSLKIGQELSFNEDLIKEAIDNSQKLTQKQLQNLHQYVLLVPSLAT